MRKSGIHLALMGVAVVLSVAPLSQGAAGDATGGSCTASTGATASASRVLSASAPSCTFIVTCQEPNCLWEVGLAANGTGLVAASMSAATASGEPVGFRYTSGSGGGSAANPACGPQLFHCSVATSDDGERSGPVLGTDRQSLVIRCTGGGLAAFESVNCSLTSVF